jgi:serine/threonine protein kinase
VAGIGIVYRATDTRLARQVALKVLPPQYGGDETFRTRFLRESRIAASIDHPGVIPIYEAGEADGRLYIAMRHVDGADLGALLREEGALDPERAVELVSQLAEAVDAAHAAGLVHRDIKPSNALLGTAGGREHVYLCDFGLSKEATGDTTLSGTGALIGTVKPMAPEVRHPFAGQSQQIFASGRYRVGTLAENRKRSADHRTAAQRLPAAMPDPFSLGSAGKGSAEPLRKGETAL